MDICITNGFIRQNSVEKVESLKKHLKVSEFGHRQVLRRLNVTDEKYHEMIATGRNVDEQIRSINSGVAGLKMNAKFECPVCI